MDYDSSKDYYSILRVDATATEDEIKRAFRRLARKYHPDVNMDRLDWADSMMKVCNEAYTILMDAEQRKAYDRAFFTKPGMDPGAMAQAKVFHGREQPKESEMDAHLRKIREDKHREWEEKERVNARKTESAKEVFAQEFGYPGSERGMLAGPLGITLKGDEIWIVDSGNHRLHVFNILGEQLRRFGGKMPREEDQMMLNPTGIVFRNDEELYVTDTGNKRILHLDVEGKVLNEFGRRNGPGAPPLKKPSGIALGPDGRLVVCDYLSSKIFFFDQEGRLVFFFGEEGMNPGQLMYPVDVVVSPENEIWVVDEGNDRVQRFDVYGNLMSRFGERGEESARFKTPQGINLDPNGNLLVVDEGNTRVQKFNSQGRFLNSIGGKGKRAGQFIQPYGVVTDKLGRVYVTDRGSSRVQVFKYI